MDIQRIYNERFALEKEFLGTNKPVNKITPKVSVCVITYQHKNFIKDCIEGILMQKVNFPYEIIIGEDESTDGTREICKEYAKRYPEKIRLFLRNRKTSQLHDEKGNYIGRFNGKWNRKSARGKYIGLCEGDDYWTDPYKLQKQVDFLEAHENYVISFHDCKIIDEKGLIIKGSKLGKHKKNNLTRPQIISGSAIPTMSAVFRNLPIVHKMTKEIFKVRNGDTFLFAMLGQYGKAYYHQDIQPAVYRIHGGGVWSKKKGLEKLKSSYNTFLAISKGVKKRYWWSSRNIALITLNKIKNVDQNFFNKEVTEFSLLRRYYIQLRHFIKKTFQK